MKTLVKIFWILSVMTIPVSLNAAVCTALSNGNWSDPAIWSCGVTPGCGDLINIPSGITVFVDTQVDLDENSSPACSTATYIHVSGILQFITGNKISLACGSGVEIMPGGSMLPGGGGGSSNWLKICEVTEWKTSDGPVFGYRLFGSPIPLSTKLINFEGQEVSANQIKVFWTVSSESNNKGFMVQISADGVDWDLYGFVQSVGNHSEIKTYMLQNALNSIHHGEVFLRLIEVDLNEEQTVLEEISVRVSQSDLKVFPNPSTEEDLITIQSQIPIDIEQLSIVDPQGRVFDITRFINQVNENTIQIDPLSLVTGVYQIHLASQVVRIVIK